MGVAPETLEFRLRASERYFVMLHRAISNGVWDTCRVEWGGVSATLPAKLVLLHPLWLEFGGETTARRARRSFGMRVPPSAHCESEQLWGYGCPFGSRAEIEVDHLFPWALGGPTIAENALFLCRHHNRAKGHDVHLIPWEQPGHFGWVDAELEQVAQLVTSRGIPPTHDGRKSQR